LRRIAIFLLFGLSTTLFAEVSAFGAGDLKSDNPYGLSESEKVVFSNKKSTLENRRAIKALKMQVRDLQESLEGLRSVVSSLSEKMGETGAKLHQLDQQPKGADASEIAELKAELEAQKMKNEKIMQTLRKLTVMIDNINSDYVPRSELKNLKKKVTSKRSSVKKEKTKSSKAMLAEAIKAYRAKEYEKAKALFETLDARNYKRATSNYYLGELSYYQKRYPDAIVYYKKSASLYDKASYMPTLLLHTGLSFKKMGEKENATRFFEAVVENYPDTPQAKIARKNL
jgi:TolA-binding protein